MTGLRVAHMMAGADAGGAELFFERLVAAQARAGDQVLALIRKNAARQARLQKVGVAPQVFTFGGPWDVWTKPLLARALRKFAPQVAVAWMGRAGSHAPRGDYVLAGRLGGQYDLARFAACDHLLANTETLKNWIVAQGFAENRTHVVPNFVDDHLGATAATLPVPAGCKTILALGRLHTNKGFDVLIAALTRLPKSVHAVIAGDGPERAALQTLAVRAGVADRVHFLGWRHDVANLLAACDVFVCSSRHEPLGNMVLDAFSAAKPIVAAMSDGPRELITPGKNGVLVAVDSAIALAAGIESVLDTPVMAAKIASNGRALFAQNFTEAAVVTAWRTTLLGLAKI